jgi:hypothetical protein
MNKERFSLNWGKGAVLVALIVVGILLVLFAGNLVPTANAIGVAVDWGSSPRPPCPANNPKCNLAVNWGSLTAPCLPTDPKCGSGPVAVDWGSGAPAPCILKDLNCKPRANNSRNPLPVLVAVNWGSKPPP